MTKRARAQTRHDAELEDVVQEDVVLEDLVLDAVPEDIDPDDVVQEDYEVENAAARDAVGDESAAADGEVDGEVDEGEAPRRGDAALQAVLEDAVLEVVQLFEQHAEQLRFPDLSHDVLRAHCDRVHERHRAIERAEAAYREAQRALDEARACLRSAAERGVAYASIYAQGDSVMSERLARLRLQQPPRPAARKRGGRRKKLRPESEGLFEVTESEGEEAPPLRHVAGAEGGR